MGQAHTILSRARLPVPPLRRRQSIPENEILVNRFLLPPRLLAQADTFQRVDLIRFYLERCFKERI